MAKYIISVTAKDTSGIIAGVSAALLKMQGNIHAASQTVHQGYFAMILLCEFTDEHNVDTITNKIHKQFDFDVHVYVTPYDDQNTGQSSDGDHYIVTILGPDKPGILNEVTTLMAARNINVEDLYCYINPKGEFVVILQVSIADQRAFGVIQRQLEDIGSQMGLMVNMQHEDIFIATNELNLRRKK